MIRKSKVGSLVLAIAVGVVGAMTVTGPAHADPAGRRVHIKNQGGPSGRFGSCLHETQRNQYADITTCNAPDHDFVWIIEEIAPAGGGYKRRIKLYNRDTDKCLNTATTSSNQARIIGCNASLDQWWEVHDRPGGTFQLKSWGDYINRSKHTCPAVVRSRLHYERRSDTALRRGRKR
jgi:hypothetical protein